MYLNSVLSKTKAKGIKRLIATYDVFEFDNIIQDRHMMIRLIATYDVFEFAKFIEFVCYSID